VKKKEFQVSYFDLLRVGDLQLTAQMMGQANILIIDPDGFLLGTSNPNWVSMDAVGQPLDMEVLPGLEIPLNTALGGEIDIDRLFVSIIPYEKFYFAVPIFAEPEDPQRVLAVGVIYVETLPTKGDLAANTSLLVTRSVLIFLLVAGLIGTIFGYLTAKGMAKRLQRISQVTDSWSQGDFSQFIEDTAGDEISQLTIRLSNMAE